MKLINATESRDIRPFNKQQLQGIVEDIDKLNERKVTKKLKNERKIRSIHSRVS